MPKRPSRPASARAVAPAPRPRRAVPANRVRRLIREIRGLVRQLDPA